MEIYFTSENISHLTPYVHDKFFDIDDLCAKYENNMSFNLYDVDLFGNKYPVLSITIFPVQDINAIDSERVGLYDINYINFDESKCALCVNTGIPLVLDIILENPNFKIVCRELRRLNKPYHPKTLGSFERIWRWVRVRRGM